MPSRSPAGCSGPIRLSIWLLSPFARMAAWMANRIVRLLGLSPTASPFAHALSEDEIRALISGSDRRGMAGGEEGDAGQRL